MTKTRARIAQSGTRGMRKEEWKGVGQRVKEEEKERQEEVDLEAKEGLVGVEVVDRTSNDGERMSERNWALYLCMSGFVL